MSTVVLRELSPFFNMDPEDPIFQKELIRPAEIKEDVKLMEQRKRVTNIMRSKLFKKNLENIFKLNAFDDEFEGESTSTLSLAEISEQLLLSALQKTKSIHFINVMQCCLFCWDFNCYYRCVVSQRKGVIFINDLHCGINSPYDQVERLSRCKLASVFRLIDMYGWKSGFDSTMTVRPFRDREQFLINPFGLMLHELTASSLISLDFKGNILDFGSTVLEANPISWLIHSAVYSSRREIRAILHLKTVAALTVSSNNLGLIPLSAESILLGDVLILHQLDEIEQNPVSQTLILTHLKNYLTGLLTTKSKVLIVPNNGMLICGDTIEEAWHLLTNCQQACETQLKIGNLDLEDLFIPQKHVQNNIFSQWCTTDIGGISKTNDAEETLHSQWRIGELEFEALMRHLDNNGYRSGYFYHREYIYHSDLSTKSDPHSVNYEVEIPPSSISVVNSLQHYPAAVAKPRGETPMSLRLKNEKWFNTPNSYKLIEENGDSVNDLSFDLAGSKSDRKSAKWISAKKSNFSAPIPQRPVTAGAYVVFGCDASKSDISKDKIQPRINPKELKENQKRVKNKYYHDTNTAGPISCLLDSGLSREDVRRLKNVTLQNQLGRGASVDEIVTAASKAVIQRGHKALVYQDLYRPSNPFENITTDELDNYHREIDRKLNPHQYNIGSTDEIDCGTNADAPEIKITVSRSETSVLKQSLYDEENIQRETGLMSDSDAAIIDAQNKTTATLSAPCYSGAITSETSGADISHDEVDKEGKAKKKKRRFKLPSFSKKKKADKAAKN